MSEKKNDLPAKEKSFYKSGIASLIKTILSLFVFIAVDYFIFKSWGAVCLLVSVILIHECGHFVAMKIFGYKHIKMIFVPFVGAYVSGEASHFSKSKKIIMLLAGPVPGLIAGMVLLYFYQQNFNQYYYLAALAFLLLNGFNLLPVTPLDGGQIIETLFVRSGLVIQFIFMLLALATLIYSIYVFKLWILIIVTWFVLKRISSLFLTYQVRIELNKKNIAYQENYDDLNEDEYCQIRDVLVTKSKVLSKRFLPAQPSAHEADLVKYIEKILIPVYHYELGLAQKVTLLAIYLSAIILPVLQWLYFKTSLQ